MSELAAVVEPLISTESDTEYSPVTRANARVGVAMLDMAAFFARLKQVDEASLANKRIKAPAARKIGGGVLLGLVVKAGVPMEFVHAVSSAQQAR